MKYWIIKELVKVLPPPISNCITVIIIKTDGIGTKTIAVCIEVKTIEGNTIFNNGFYNLFLLYLCFHRKPL